MKTIEEIRDWLLENAVDEDGDLVLSDLGFSDFEGGVYINSMKVQGDLSQSGHEVQGTLYQYGHEVQGHLFQHEHEVQGNLYNKNNKYGGSLYETPSTKLLNEITTEELAKLGYKLKEETKMKVGDKVYCNDGYGGFTGWIASIDDSLYFPYSVVKDAKDIGKSFKKLGNLYEYDSEFKVYKLEDLTLLQDDPNGFNEKDSIERDKQEETK